jgi:hypothetical protein
MKTMDAMSTPRLPDAARAVVRRHIELLNERLPGMLDSYYIVGSAALGAYDEKFSDIDFVSLMKTKPQAGEIKQHKRIHRELRRRFPHVRLDGIYVAREVLANGCPERVCPRFNAGVYLGLKRFDAGSVEAWQLKKHSICAFGKRSESLPFNVNSGALLERMRGNLDTYWRKWADDCKKPRSLRFLGLLFRHKSVEWGVLGISRLYYSFRQRDIASKAAAGEYALKTLPERWHRIVREALRLRDPGIPPQYASRIVRRNDALKYVEHMMRECARVCATKTGKE